MRTERHLKGNKYKTGAIHNDAVVIQTTFKHFSTPMVICIASVHLGYE